MSSINSVRQLQILYFSQKNKKIKNLKNGEKEWSDIGIYTYYYLNASGRVLTSFGLPSETSWGRPKDVVIWFYKQG